MAINRGRGMRGSGLAFLTVWLLFSGFPAFGQTSEKDIEQLYDLPLYSGENDFIFSVAQENYPANPRIILFKLKRLQSEEGIKYTLRYFFQGRLEEVVADISLPYVFKRSFTGQKKGEYSVSFELRDGQGKVSSLTQKIWVE